MKAMVLAAGLGERLRPLTLQRAKPALRLVDRPVLRHVLDWLAGWGVCEAVVNLHHLPETVRRALDGGPPLGVGIAWSEEPEVLGTGGGLGAVREAFRAEEAFALVNGDCLYGLDVRPALELHRARRPAATMVLMDHPGGGYAGVEVDAEGRVRRIAGRPEWGGKEAGLRTLHFPGIHLLGPLALEAIPASGPSDIHRDALVPLIEAGAEVLGVACAGRWHDVGTPARYLRATRDELEARGGGPWIAASARIHPDARVDGASVLGDGVRVEAGARIERSVLLDGAAAGEGSRVSGSVLGYGTWLEAGRALEGRVRAETGGRFLEVGVEGGAR